MPKALSAGMITAKNTLDQTDAWVVLFEVLTEGDPIHITNHPTTVVYLGSEYSPFPVMFDAISEEQGRVQKLSIHVSNVTREIQAYLEFNDGMRGKRVRMYIINKDHPEYGAITESFVIESTMATEKVVTFTLGRAIPVLDVRLPRRLITRDLFPSLPRS